MKRLTTPVDQRPLLITALLWLSILPGQLLRIDLKMSTAGILASDLAVFAVLLFAGLSYRQEWKKWRSDPATRLLALWGGILTLSCLVALPYYGLHNGALAFAYLVRLLAYLALFVVFAQLGASVQRPFIRYAIVALGGLFLLGLIILAVLPDFAPLAAYGWDPHVGRFTSTWLDPNFFGTFLALSAAGALCFERKLGINKWRWLVFTVFYLLCGFGIYATVSRSAVVTFAVAACFAGIRTSWRALGLAVLTVILLLAVPSRLQQRLDTSISYVGSGSASSSAGTSGTTLSSTSSDPTANDRINSWKRAWELTKHAPILGVGYNNYEPAAVKYGLLQETGETRGTSGSDSSILTLLATSGFLGIIAFGAWASYLIYSLFRKRTPWTNAALAAIVGLAIGSQLNNAFLYPFILLPFIMLMGIAYADSRRP